MDTNNPAELPPSIGRAEIVQIIDHHKLSGGLTTLVPGGRDDPPAGLHLHDHGRT